MSRKKRILFISVVLIALLTSSIVAIDVCVGTSTTFAVHCKDPDDGLSKCIAKIKDSSGNVLAQNTCTVSGTSATCSVTYTCPSEGTYYVCGEAIDSHGASSGEQCESFSCVICCTPNGQACNKNSDCCSNHCSVDFDGSGSWCCDSNQCAHDGTCYDEGTTFNYNGGTYTCHNGAWTNCYPPPSGNWVIVESCSVKENLVVNGNLIINGGDLTIDNGATITVNGNIVNQGTLKIVNGKLLKKS